MLAKVEASWPQPSKSCAKDSKPLTIDCHHETTGLVTYITGCSNFISLTVRSHMTMQEERNCVF